MPETSQPTREPETDVVLQQVRATIEDTKRLIEASKKLLEQARSTALKALE